VAIRARLVGAGGETYTAFGHGSLVADKGRPAVTPVPLKYAWYELRGKWGFGHVTGRMQRGADGYFTAQASAPAFLVGQRVAVTVRLDLGPIGGGAEPLASQAFEVQL